MALGLYDTLVSIKKQIRNICCRLKLVEENCCNGGGGSTVLTALPFTTDHVNANGNQYVIGDVVYYNGNIYRCIANNDSILPTNASYWTNLGVGNPLVEQPSDWNSTSGNNQILNKPTIPIVTPSALTKIDDTNVTLTLGGSPSTALLASTSLTLGWTGTLADSRIASASTWNAKEPGITAGTTSQYWRGDKTWQTLDKSAVGLSNVDNTSDLNKPVSIATQTAIDNISVGNKLYLFNNY